MRIAIVSTPFVPVPPPRYGGTELVVAELCRGLASAGHHVTLFTCGGSTVPCDVRWLHPEARWPPDPYVELDHAAWATEQILADDRFDLIHAHVAALVSFARFLDVPMVYTVHHDREAPAYRHAYDSLYRRAPIQLVCISERQRQLSPVLGRAVVIHHGVDPERHPLGAGAGGYAAFLGRFDRCKGAHHAVDAAHAAGVPLLLGGVPHERDGYFEATVRPRLERSNARLLGPLGGQRKIDFLRNARALLFPIEWEEPFGLVMIEAMLCGTPVIAFPGGAVGEVVDEGVTGFVVHTVEEMATRLRSLDQFDRQRCRRRAIERWSTQRMIDDHLRLYQALLERSEAAVHERRGTAPTHP